MEEKDKMVLIDAVPAWGGNKECKNMNLSFIDGRSRSCFFAGIVGLTIISLLIAFVIGAKQDQVYRENYARYQKALQLMGDKKYDQALQIFTGLDADSQASYQIQYMEAFCLMQTGDYMKAAGYMQRARETRPALLMDQKYLERYGVILYQLGEYQRAKLYLQQSLKYPEDAATTQEARSYLSAINNKL